MNSVRITVYHTLSSNSGGSSYSGNESAPPAVMILATLVLLAYMIYLLSKATLEYLKESKEDENE